VTVSDTVVSATAALTDEQPIEGRRGATFMGPRNLARERENPSLLRPPSTDHGAMPNLRFSFADAHMKMREGGWSREVTTRDLPVSTTMAGVNMRLTSGGVRELHWHKQAEWSFMLAGTARVTAVDTDGRTFIADIEPGDLWYFPGGIPHSIQGLPPNGCEFLLAFPDGEFSEDATFDLTDLFAHMPRDALAKDLRVAMDALDVIPREDRFIFQAPPPPPLQEQVVNSPEGAVSPDMKFRLMQQPPTEIPGGRVRIAHTSNFPIATQVATALVEVDPGHMREIHWHPNADEWQYYIGGRARMSVFGASGNARTFDYQAGDVGYVPKSMAHFIENTGTEPLRFLELFKAPRFVDMSMRQWLALTPHDLVAAHLNVPADVIASLPKDKNPIA
jgi:oxalate decarboxylase